MAPNWPLVGRSEELRFLHRAILDEQVSAIVIGGPAGVGKTRLACEALAWADGQGLATGWGVATASAAGIPFGAVAHLLPHPLPPSLGLSNLLRALGESIVGAHGAQRFLLGVDDAHLLDHFSAALVHHLAATGRAFVLATVRTGEEAPDAVRSLAKDLGERLELQNLSRGHLEELVPAALAGEVDRAALRQLWVASRGNVLLLRELIAGGLAAGTLEAVAGQWRWRGSTSRLPGLVELIESRLAALTPSERGALEVVSAAEPLGLRLIEPLLSPAAVEALERSGLVQLRSDGRRAAVSVSHPLYAEVIRATTPGSRTMSIAAGLARALEATGARRREDLLRLAIWWVEAGVYDRPERLVAAARQAALALDFPLAERLARAAGEAGGPGAQLLLAEAVGAQGRFREAEDLYVRAESTAQTEPDTARAAVARAMNLFWGLGAGSEAEHVIQRAESVVRDPLLRDELAATRALFVLFGGRTDEAIVTASSVVDRPGASDVAVTQAGVTAMWGHISVGSFERCSSVAARVEEVGATASPVLPFGLQVIRMLASDIPLFLEGRLLEAAAHTEADYEDALEQGWDPLVPMTAWGLGWMLRVQGKLGRALARQREAAGTLRHVDLYRHLSSCLGEIAHSAALRGDVVTAEAALAEAEAVQVPSFRVDCYFVGMARAWTAAARGELSLAASVAEETAESCAAMGQCTFEALALYEAARLGEARSVAKRLVELAERVEGELVPAMAAHATAVATGDEAGLVRAADAFEAVGALLYAAEAAADASRAAAATGRKSTAMALAARARSLAAHCEGARTPALADLDHPLPLTRREREVATLAARGLSNREIAERLVVSVRTAEGHLNRAFAKLGVTQRADLRSILGGEPTGRSGRSKTGKGTTNGEALSERDAMPHER